LLVLLAKSVRERVVLGEGKGANIIELNKQIDTETRTLFVGTNLSGRAIQVFQRVRAVQQVEQALLGRMEINIAFIVADDAPGFLNTPPIVVHAARQLRAIGKAD